MATVLDLLDNKSDSNINQCELIQAQLHSLSLLHNVNGNV